MTDPAAERGAGARRTRSGTRDRSTPLGGLLDLLFPPRCAGCRRRGQWLCAACLARLMAPAPGCPRCGTATGRPGLCPTCRAAPPAFDRAWSAYRYAEPLRSAIHRFKYGGERALAPTLGRLLTEAIEAAALDFDLVVPVPLHPDRLRGRGYNQSELLARTVAERHACPLATDLVRVRPTVPQVGQSRVERRANVAGAFAWRGSALAGRRVLLIDDVCTTGATLDACARALRPHGPSSILATSLARD